MPDGTRVKVFLTGLPGSGKSTVMLRCAEGLRERGLSVGGISTPELREGGKRVGFRVLDLASGGVGLMAGFNVSSTFRVGRYAVDVESFESVALPALDHAEAKCDVVCIDEIGRMELYSKPFEQRVEELVRSPKPLLAVLHRDYTVNFGRFGKVFTVSPENRGHLPKVIIPLFIQYIGNQGVN